MFPNKFWDVNERRPLGEFIFYLYYLEQISFTFVVVLIQCVCLFADCVIVCARGYRQFQAAFSGKALPAGSGTAHKECAL